MELIIKSIQREYSLKALLALSFPIIGTCLILWNRQEINIYFFVGWLICLFGMFYFPKTLLNLKQINNNNLITQLLKFPNEVVWVYSIKTQLMPFGIQLSNRVTVFFKTIDGKENSLRVPEKDLPKIMEFLNQQLPLATFGYSQEKSQWYAIDPAMLIRDEK